MNRLEASPATLLSPSTSTEKTKDPTKPLELFTAGTAHSPSAAGLLCDNAPPATTFAPVHYEEGYAYPLLVWLHGDGQTDRDLPTVMSHVSVRNYVAAAPRGESVTVSNGADSRHGWCDSHEAAADADERVAAAIELAADRFNIRHDRVFLAGVGSGGTTALRVGLANPTRFAGVASFDGPMPLGGRPLRSVTRSRQLPLMLASSQESHAYPQAQVCRDLRLLHTAGCQVHLRQYPGDDELTTVMLSDLDKWMMEIVCGG